MAEISDEQFKEEILRMMKTAILKIGDNSKEINLLRKDVDKSTREFKNLKKEFQINSGKVTDIRFRVLEMWNRLFEIEKRLETFSERLTDIKREIKRIFSELSKIIESAEIENIAEATAKFNELDLQIEKLEEQVFTI